MEPRNALRRRERLVAHARLIVAVFAGVQVWLYRAPRSDLTSFANRARPWALGILAALVVVALVAEWVIRRLPSGRLRVGGASIMAADVAIVFAFLAVYAFDPVSPSWVGLLLLPIEGAIRYGMAGALGVWGLAVPAIWLRAEFVERIYGYPHVLSISTFRLGVILLAAVLAGGLVNELERTLGILRSANRSVQDFARLREPAEVLQSLCASVVRTLDARTAVVYEWDGESMNPVAAVPPEALAKAIIHPHVSAVDFDPLERSQGIEVGGCFVLLVPLRWHEHASGTVLAVEMASRRRLTVAEEVAESLAQGATIALVGLRWLAEEHRAVRHLTYLEALRRHLAAAAAHDIRMPLTVFRGVSRVLRMNWPRLDAHEIDDMLASIERQTNRLSRLADDLLDAARIDADRLVVYPEPVDFADVVHRVLPDLETDVEVDLTGDLRLAADPDRLERVLWNLLTNAQRHGASPIVLHARRDGDRLVFSVRDHGPGLEPERRDMLGEEFVASEDPASVGLGLAIITRLVGAHGGTLHYEEAAPGARFIVSLPTRPEASE